MGLTGFENRSGLGGAEDGRVETLPEDAETPAGLARVRVEYGRGRI